MLKSLFLPLAFLAIAAFSQTKTPITHEIMWSMKRVSAPEISPDGKWVVFSVTEPSYDEKEAVTDLWVVPADGSAEPRRLTGNKSGESGQKWSPDGKLLAFSAKRDGDDASQIYILNFKEGGEAYKLTNVSTGASAPQWSPDGKYIAFTSKTFPGAATDSANKKMAEEKKKQKYKARVYTSFPIRLWDVWRDEQQTHIMVQPLTGGEAKDILAGWDGLNGNGYLFSGQYCWAPDGESLVFAAITDNYVSAYQEPVTKLLKVNRNGGGVSILTNDANNNASPAFSIDGKTLYCLSSTLNNYKIYNLDKLVSFDWPSMQNRTVVIPSMDRPVNAYAPVGDHDLVLSIEDQGRDKLLRYKAADKSFESINASQTGCNPVVSCSADGSVVASTYDDASHPTEIVRILPSDKSQRAITHFNDARVASLDMPAVEEVWFTSSKGKKIRSLMLKPAGFDAQKKYPLFVVIHGGPAGAWKDNWGYRWNYQLLAAPGYVLLMTDYTGSTGYGEKFTQDIQYDPLKGAADEVNEAAKDAIKRFSFIDGSRQAAGGGSYGGHLAVWLEATTSHYKCLISHAGMINSETQWGTSDFIYNREEMNGGPPWKQTKSWKEQNAVRLAEQFKTPMLVTAGELDYRVPVNNAVEIWSVLQRMKVPGKLIIFPEENHWILKAEDSRFWYKEVQDWLAKYLKQ